MRDKRPVDELTIEELERILMMRKREARMQRFRGDDTRRVDVPPPATMPPVMSVPVPPAPQALPATVEAASAALIPVATALIPDDGVPRFEDEMPYTSQPVAQVAPSAPRPSGLWRAVTDKFLLVIEVGAILGLMAVLYIAYSGIQRINNNIQKTDAISATSEAELMSRLIKPTATPELFIRQVVLPGGHIYSETGNHQFNINEVPSSYRAAYIQNVVEAPPQAFQQLNNVPGRPVRIEIPAIGVNASVRAGDDWETLQAAVGHQPYSANPGQQGNMVLAGHNDIYGEVFRRLPELAPGAEIYIQTEDGKRYTYVVSEGQDVDPVEGTWVLRQDLSPNPMLTLITCYPYRVNDRRWIVFAELQQSS